MKMKKIMVLSMTMLTAVALSACGSSNSGTDTAGKEPSSTKTAASEKKSSSSKKSETSEVTNGPLIKVGQWKDDSMQGKMKLVKIVSPNKDFPNGQFTLTIKDVKIFEITPVNDDQKKLASDTFNSTGVTTPYYEVQVTYAVKNGTAKPAQFNGVKSLVTSTGQQMDMNGGLQDQGTGSEIAAGATKETACMGLIKAGDQDKITKVTVNADNMADTSTFETIAEAWAPIDISLQ
jgi:hypothetical protein